MMYKNKEITALRAEKISIQEKMESREITPSDYFMQIARIDQKIKQILIDLQDPPLQPINKPTSTTETPTQPSTPATVSPIYDPITQRTPPPPKTNNMPNDKVLAIIEESLEILRKLRYVYETNPGMGKKVKKTDYIFNLLSSGQCKCFQHAVDAYTEKFPDVDDKRATMQIRTLIYNIKNKKVVKYKGYAWDEKEFKVIQNV